MRKIVVFPNDPLSTYCKKGEVKERYLNPEGLFDEVHVISLCDKEIAEDKVGSIAGRARLKIYPVGAPRFWRLPFLAVYRNKIMAIISKIKPDVIRGFNPLINGWLAVNIGRKLGIPTVISLHGDHDRDIRYQLKIQKRRKEYFIHYLYGKFVEPYSISQADKIICKYRFPVGYAKKYGAKNIEVIYNWVDIERFTCENRPQKSPLIVLCVGRLIKEKNQECLVRAVKDLNVELILIGDGPEYIGLRNLIEELRISNKVKILRSVPHDKIDEYYKIADIFALPILYGGIAIPVMEAMASSLPLVVPRPLYESEPELVKDIAIVVDNNPESFKKGIESLILNPRLRQELGVRGRRLMEQMNGRIMERKEKELYESLFKRI